jgi:hypothetical protein
MAVRELHERHSIERRSWQFIAFLPALVKGPPITLQGGSGRPNCLRWQQH